MTKKKMPKVLLLKFAVIRYIRYIREIYSLVDTAAIFREHPVSITQESTWCGCCDTRMLGVLLWSVECAAKETSDRIIVMRTAWSSRFIYETLARLIYNGIIDTLIDAHIHLLYQSFVSIFERLSRGRTEYRTIIIQSEL